MPANTTSTGFLGRHHYRLRFDELPECFFGRFVLLRANDQTSSAPAEIVFSLHDLYPTFDSVAALEAYLSGVCFSRSNKMVETVADGLSVLTGDTYTPATKEQTAFELYNSHIASRLHWLRVGDAESGAKACIDSYRVETDSPLHRFRVQFRPSHLANALAENFRAALELPAQLIALVESRSALPTVRIDYRKQLEFLTAMLDQRPRDTGERQMSFLSTDYGFRHGLADFGDPSQFTMALAGTTTVADKILLPLFLETNGLLDVLGLSLRNDPRDPDNVVVNYFIERPVRRNVYQLYTHGLTSELRALLNETEIVLYERIHSELAQAMVFGGRQRLEGAFGELMQWLIRKAAYCLEEPTFLKTPARSWLSEHDSDRRVEMEDGFFLPFIYERLREKFGGRVVKKPERFAGEIDILFDDTIPIELKVRRGRTSATSAEVIDDCFRPAGQAASYAAVSRLGMVLLLDLPEQSEAITNLEHCCQVVTREFSASTDFPTAIVVLVFHCHHPRPSSVS